MHSKGSPKFIPSDDMTGRLHSIIMIPPDAGGASKLLSGEERFVLI
jgi:hypothetical protein